MENSKAIEILNSLADGIDPFTHILFPPDSPYQQADVVRALFLAIEALKAPQAPRKASGPARPASARLWTPEEEQRLHDAFAAQKPVSEIAAAHERTTGGITARLIRLGLIEAPRHTSYPPNNRAAPAPAATAKDLEDMPF
ncbi:MAG: hypothetical protein FJ222_04295 [Lentisphaerae bacterium]|nr:hypothetical protein [Lentisphaerota bacterium]